MKQLQMQEDQQSVSTLHKCKGIEEILMKKDQGRKKERWVSELKKKTLKHSLLSKSLAAVLAFSMTFTSSGFSTLATEIEAVTETDADTAALESEAAARAAAESEAAARAAAELEAAARAAAESEAAAKAAAESEAAAKAAAESEAAAKEAVQETAATEADNNDAEVRKNVVTFQVQEGAAVTVDGADATNATAMAKEGEIVFTVTPADGFAVTEVLVDGVTPARTTGNLNEYVIGGIQTDETIVSVSTQAVETEPAADDADEPATEEETTEEETTEPASGDGSEAETATLTVNYFVEYLSEDAESVREVLTESDVYSEGLYIGEEIAYADYVKDFSAEYPGIACQNADQTAVLEAATEIDLVYAMNYDISTLDETEAEKEIYTIAVYYVDEKTNTRNLISSDQYEEGGTYSIAVPTQPGYTITPQDEDGNPLTVSDGYVVGTVASDLTINMVASASRVSYVVKHMLQDIDGTTYVEPEEGSEYYETVEGTTGEMTNAGFKDIEGFEPQAFVQTEISGSGDTVIEIKYDRKQVSLSYNTDGGSYVDRQFALYGQNVKVSGTIPTKAGYTFDGWYDGDKKVEAETEITLDGSKVLTARWSAKNVSYKVIYFKQQTDGSYIAAGEETKTAQAGQTVTVTGDAEKFAYYHFAGSDTDNGAVTVAGDGTTAINVYYDLNVYTLSFDLRNSGLKFKDGTTTYSFTARLGDDISELWPTADKINEGNYNYFESWNPPVQGAANYMTPRPILDDSMIPESATYTNKATLGYSVNTTRNALTSSVAYMKQTIEAAESNSSQIGLTNYEEDRNLRAKYSGRLSAKDLFGFEHYQNSSNTKPAGVTQAFYYTRHIYKLTRINHTTSMGSVDVPFEKSLSSYLVTPTRPSDVPSYYEFKGWYANPQGAGEPLGADATMPGFAKNGSEYIIYAVWKPVTVTVEFDTDGGSTVDSQKIEAGTTAAEPAVTPTKEGYDFVGWYTSTVSNAQQFRFDQPITQNTTVYARWKEKTIVKYTVQYVDENGKAVADAVEKEGIVNTTVRENPKVVSGYVTTETEKELTLSRKESENVITFVYHVPQNYDYYARYYYLSNGQKIYLGDPVKSGNVVENSSVYVTANNVPDGYKLNDLKRKKLTVTADTEDNYIDFCVERDFTVSVTDYIGVYDGAGHTIGVTVTDPISEENGFTVEYASSENGPWSADAINYTNVADTPATVYVRVTHNTTGAVKTTSGTVTITPREVSFAGESGERVYTGALQSLTGVNATGLLDGHTHNVVAEAAGTTVGEYQGTITAADDVKIYTGEEDVTANYTVTTTPGKLKITPVTDKLTVTITGNHKTETYNGTEQSVTGFTSDAPENVSVALKEGRKAEAKGTNAATYNMNLSADDFSVTSDNYTDIEVKVIDGWLKIDPITEEVEVKITGNHDTKEYNGSEQSVTGYVVDENVPETITVTLTEGEAVAKGTTVGRYEMGLTAEQFTAVSPNYTNIKITVTDGWLEITKASTPLTVQIKGNTAAEVYNGQEQSVIGFTSDAPANVSVLLKEGKEAKAAGTNAGKYPMNLTQDDFTVTSDNYETINVEVTDGWLEITPVTDKLTVTVEGNMATEVYNGQEQSVTGFTSDAPETVSVALKEGKEAKAAGTDAGMYPMNLKAEDFTASSPNYTNIEVVVKDGYLEITPKDTLVVNVTGNNATKEYNGSEQYVTGFTSDAPADVTVTLKEGEAAEARGINKGRYPMGLTADMFTAASDNYKDIVIVVTDGWLEITPNTKELKVTITGNNKTEEYNGSEQSVTGFTSDAPATVNVALAEGSTAEAKGTVVGTYSMGLTEDDFVVTSENYSNITVEVVDGWLEITPNSKELKVTITGNNAVKEYNGNEQSVTGFTSDAPATVNVALAEGSAAEAKGTVVGTYNMGLTEDDFVVTSANYSNITVEVADGWLEITPQEAPLTVVITGNTDRLTYNGTEQSVTGYSDDAPANVDVALKAGRKAEAKGTVVGTYTMGLTEDDFTVSSENYKTIHVIVVDGWLQITPIETELTVTITGNTATKRYNGTEQSVEGYKDDAPANVTVALVGSRQAKANGTVVGTYNMGLTEKDFSVTSENYTNIKVVVEDGWLKITPDETELTVTITGNTDTQVYNGTEQRVTGYTSDAPANVDVELKAGSTAEAKGTTVGTYNMGLTEDSFVVTSDNYTNIKVVVEDGWLKITPVTDKLVVNITGNTATREYNELEQSITGFTSDAPANVDVALKAERRAEAKGTTAGTYYMGLTAEDFEVTSENYTDIEVVVTDGWLKITPKDTLVVTIKGNSESKVYNGTEQVVTGYEDDAPANVTVALAEGSKAEARGTVAGTYPMNLTKDDFVVTSENYRNIVVIVEDGNLTITPITETLMVTITGNNDTRVYNGNEQSVTGFTSDAPANVNVALAGGSKAEAKGIAAGTYQMGLTAADFVVTSDNYEKIEVVVIDGYLTITPITTPIIITANDKTKVYDGTPLTEQGYTYTEHVLLEGDVLTAVVEGSAINVGDEGVNTVTGYKVMRGTTDVTSSYIFGDSVNGRLTITKRPVTLTSATAEKPYDGTPLTNDTVTVSGDGFVTGEGASYEVTGSQLDAGSSRNTFSYKLNEGTKAENYEITKVEGTLTVKQSDDEIVITAASDSKTYDGTPLTNAGFTYSGTLAKGDVLTAVVEGSQTDAGASANKVTGYKVMRGEGEGAVDVTANYRFGESIDGTLTVTKRKVTLTSASDSKPYDGTPLTNDMVTVSGDGFVTGEGASYEVTGSQLDAGSSANSFTYALSEGTKADNYEITKTEGTLTVTKADTVIVVKANSKSKTYDGTALTEDGFTYTGMLVEGDVLTAVVKGSQTNAGTSANEVISYAVMRGEGENAVDVTANYTFGEPVDGTLTVAKRPVTLTSATASKTYDGTPLTNDTVTVSGDGFAAGEGATYNVTGSQLDAGSSKNIFTYTLGENTNADNYVITKAEGDLTVTAITTQIVIKANSSSKTYDGTPLTDSGYTYTEGVLADGDRLIAEVEGSQTDAGNSANAVTSYRVVRGEGENEVDVTKNYSFAAPIVGTLTVTKRQVTMTSASDSKAYDGTALTNTTVTAGGDGFAEGEGAVYNVTGSQLDVGSSANSFTYTLSDKTNKDNYEITKTEGTLTVTPVETALIITANSNSKTYDGTPLTDAGFSYTEGVLVDGDVLTAVVEGSQTDAGSSENVVKSCRVMRGTADVTGNYTFGTSVNGTLTVETRKVTLTSATAEKTYDGTPLTNDKVTVSGDGFVTGQGASYDVTGSQLDAGSSRNTFSYKLNEGTKAENYEITKVEGTLTVKQSDDEIVITAASGSKTYDGTPLTNAGFTYSGTLAKGDVLTAVVEGSQTDAGASANKVTSYKVMRGEGESAVDVTANYKFGESVDGTLTVTKRKVTLTSATDSKPYDGTPLTNGTVTVSGDGFADGEGASYDVTGSQLDAGSSANSFTYALSEGTKADNYEITKTEGTLTVTKAETVIVVKADSSRKVYDGSALTDSGFTYTGKLIEGDVLTAVVEGSQTDAGESANVVTGYRVTRGEGEAAVDVTANYIFGKPVDGTLTVTKRLVTLTSATASKPYDGTPLTNNTVTVSGDGFAAGEGAEYEVTGSQLDAGSSKNTFTYTLSENTKAENYVITKAEGDLTVTAITAAIVITADSDEKVYDGKALVNSGYTYTGSLVEGDELTAVVEGSQTDAGESANVVTGYRVMRGETDVTKNYSFGTPINGTLKVNRRPVTFTSATDSKTYDGKALTNGEVTMTGDGFAEGEGVTFNVTGSQLDVGTSDNTFTYDWNDGTKNSNYEVTKKAGTLTVNPITTEIVITANSDEKVYDGKELTNAGFTYTENVLVEGDVLTAVVKGSQTDAGSSANVVTGYKVMRGAADVTGNYTFGDTVDGTLKVTKRSVTFTSATDEKVYDGKALTNDEVTVGGDGFAAGEGVSFDVTGSQLDAGNSRNTFTYTLNDGTKEENYEITKVEGTLTVKKSEQEIVITANSSSKMYDGRALTDDGFTYSGKLAAGDVLEAVVEGSQTDAGSSANAVKSYRVVRDGKDITDNYTFGDSADGTLTVTKRSVVLTSASDEKVYDGTPLTNSEITVSGDGFAKGEGAAYDVTGSQLDAGNSRNTFTYTLNDGTKAENYEITTVEGNLVVTKITAPITITAASDEKMYDGKALTNDGFTFEGNLVPGDILTAVVEGSQTDAGESANAVTGYRVMRGEVDATANYTFNASIDGTLTVTKRSVTLTSATDEKVYDGEPLTNDEVTVTGDGFAEGEGVTCTVTGSQLDAGTSKNAFSYIWNAGTKNANYDLTMVEGDLTVTPVTKEIVITANSNEKVYDGSELTDDGYTFTQDVLAEGDVLTAVVEGSITNVGETANKVVSYVVKRGRTDVTKNYTFAPTVDGTLTVYGTVIYDANGAAGEVPADTEQYKLGEEYTLADQNTLTMEKAEFAGWSLQPQNPTEILQPGDKAAMGETNVTYYAQWKGMALTKTDDKSEPVKVGETVTYTVTVTNTGTITLNNIVVTDELEGVTPKTQTIAQLPAGASANVTFTYVVQESDLGQPIRNVATATSEENPPADPGETETKTDDRRPHLTVVKETISKPANGESYALNETIEYKVVITNDGNVTMKDVAAVDELEGAVLSAAAEGNSNEPQTLAPGESKVVYFAYTVQEKDLGNTIVNEATASYTPDPKDPEDPKDPVDPGRTEDKPDDPNPHLDVQKAVTGTAAAEDGRYALGETITYQITVTNDGNVTIEKIFVVDMLEGVQIADGENCLIQTLAPGESASVNYQYTVQSKDIAEGSVTNTAVATGQFVHPDGTQEVRGEATVNTLVEAPKPAVSVEKTITNADADGRFKVGDTIYYNICVTNTGNIVVENITVTDEMRADDGKDTAGMAAIVAGEGYHVSGNTAVITQLEAGETINIPVIYVVETGDAGRTLTNAAIADGGNTGGRDEISVEIEKLKEEEPETEKPKDDNKPKAVQTGDNTNYMLYILMMLAAAMAGSATGIIRKRKKEDEA